jgi:hypothetical protein
LGERLLCKQEVIGSIPFTSTIPRFRDGSSRANAELDDRQQFKEHLALLFDVLPRFLGCSLKIRKIHVCSEVSSKYWV